MGKMVRPHVNMSKTFHISNIIQPIYPLDKYKEVLLLGAEGVFSVIQLRGPD